MQKLVLASRVNHTARITVGMGVVCLMAIIGFTVSLQFSNIENSEGARATSIMNAEKQSIDQLKHKVANPRSTVRKENTLNESSEILISNADPNKIAISFQAVPNAELSITNSRGQLMISNQMTARQRMNLKVDVSKFPSGTYTVKLQSEHQTISARFFKI